MKTAEEIVEWSIREFAPRLAVSTSFQKGGMIVLDMAIRIDPSLRVVTLNTGRLPEETFTMIEQVRKRYGVSVETISPDAHEVDRMAALYGPNLFYRDRPYRLLCCQVRKVRPLSHGLAGVRAVLTGLRREQSESRQSVEQVDESGAPVKINPLAYWSSEEVDAYTALHEIPVHPLYSKGYTSIGCEPCTRATLPGEDVRAGRWWWEDENTKECGIHFAPDGRAQRTVDVMLNEVVNHG